jgi:mannose-6-phosphate isomerase-like protein (cupin superfamily)
VPAVRGRALQLQLDSQHEIARHLAGAFPGELDQVGAAALTGAFIGAVTGALMTLFEDPGHHDDPAALRTALERATDVALRPWSRPVPPAFDIVFLQAAPVVRAPDGSAVRPLASIEGAGSFAEFRLGPGEIASPVVHSTVHEIWFVVAGEGQMWRRQGDRDEIVDLRPGACVTIPLGTAFQFRAADDQPLEVVAATMPPWPTGSDTEARPAPGPWTPSAV